MMQTANRSEFKTHHMNGEVALLRGRAVARSRCCEVALLRGRAANHR